MDVPLAKSSLLITDAHIVYTCVMKFGVAREPPMKELPFLAAKT